MTFEPKEKAVLQLSGGTDSGVLAYWAEDKYELKSIHFNYGQSSAEREMAHAKRISNKLGIPHEEIDISGLRVALAGYLDPPMAMIGEALFDVPGHEFGGIDATDPASSYHQVCADSYMTLSMAATYAQLGRNDHLLVGFNADDIAGLSRLGRDLPKVVEHCQGAVRAQSGDEHFRIVTPFIQYSKAKVIQLGKELGVPFELTWSCWWGNTTHCGACPPCARRQKAFTTAGVSDPTMYRTVREAPKQVVSLP